MAYRTTRRKTLRKRKGRRSSKRYRGGVKPPFAPPSVGSSGSAGSVGSSGSAGSVGSSGSSGRISYRSPSQTANSIARKKAFEDPFVGLNLNAANKEYTEALCGNPTGKGAGCPCTRGSSNFARRISGTTECGPRTTCKYDERNSIKATNGMPRFTCQEV